MKSKYSILIPKLSPNLLKYFWDCDKSKLDLNLHKSYVLNRLMQYGDIEAVKWILKNLEREYVINHLKNKGKNSLDSKSYSFWEKLCSYNDLWI
jgi:hypothetical protein